MIKQLQYGNIVYLESRIHQTSFSSIYKGIKEEKDRVIQTAVEMIPKKTSIFF